MAIKRKIVKTVAKNYPNGGKRFIFRNYRNIHEIEMPVKDSEKS